MLGDQLPSLKGNACLSGYRQSNLWEGTAMYEPRHEGGIGRTPTSSSVPLRYSQAYLESECGQVPYPGVASRPVGLAQGGWPHLRLKAREGEPRHVHKTKRLAPLTEISAVPIPHLNGARWTFSRLPLHTVGMVESYSEVNACAEASKLVASPQARPSRAAKALCGQQQLCLNG